MCNGRFELTLWAPKVAWKHKISNALVLVVADEMATASRAASKSTWKEQRRLRLAKVRLQEPDWPPASAG